MQCVKHSISLPVNLSKFLTRKAKRIARERGFSAPNVSAVLAEMVIEARNRDREKSGRAAGNNTEAGRV